MNRDTVDKQILRLSEETDQQAAILFYEFKYKTVMEAASKLMQFAIIFFSIASAITALSVLNDFDAELKKLISRCIFVIVAVFSVIGFSIMFGVISGLVQIRNTLRLVSVSTYERLDMDAYFKRGIIVLVAVAASAVIGVVSILILVFFVQ